jgi:hypothetical protein
MAEDYYDDEPESSEPSGSQTTETDESNPEPEALLPKSFFAGKELKPGTRCEIEVVKTYEDDVGVRFVGHAKEAGMAEKTPPDMDQEDSMME